MGDFVRLETGDGIGTIRLERPPMNALNTQVQEELREAAHAAAGDPSIRAVVVYGGEKVFAAGADIKMMAGLAPTQIKPVITAMQEVFSAVEEIPRVVIAVDRKSVV